MPRQKKQRLKRRKDGRYCCKADGIQFMAWTEDEALDARDKYRELKKQGVTNSSTPLLTYADSWIKSHKAGVKKTTYNAYVSILNKVLEPIQDVAISDVTPDSISKAFAALAGKSASYIRKARILLSEIMDAAVDSGYLIRNPVHAQSVKPPKGTEGSHRALTKEETDLIKSTPHRMQVPAMIMLYCGLRRGEVLALTADDIGSTISVNKAVSYVSNQPIVSGPKSTSGIRVVPVPFVLKPYLKGLSGHVCGGGEDPITEQAWQRAWENYMRVLSKAAGHEISFRAHDLRHTYCTMLRDAGVDMHQALIWMGHANEKMILKIYDHPGKSREKTAKTAFEDQIRMQSGMQKRRYRLKNGNISKVSRET